MVNISKKSQGMQFQYLITAIIVIIVVALVAYSAIKYGGADWFSNIIPTLGSNNSEKINTPGDINNQPVNLRDENSCIGVDFFWSDINGNILNGKTVKSGISYVAIKFKDTMEDLRKENNSNREICSNYQISLYANEENSKIIQSWDFGLIQSFADDITGDKLTDVYQKEINGKKYYLVPFNLESSKFWWFQKTEYSFVIKNGLITARAGYRLSVT